MADVIELPPVRLYPFCDVERARQAGLRSVEAKRRRAQQAANTPPIAEPMLPTTDFHALRLLRVRQQLEKLDAMIAEEDDAQKLDRLASAQAKLAEQERILAGRPLPGSLKPGSASRSARLSSWQVDAKPLRIAEVQPETPQAPQPSVPQAPTGSVPPELPPLAEPDPL